jgi:hypothetical protein
MSIIVSQTKEKQMAQLKTLQLAVRLPPDLRRAFISKAIPHGGPSSLLRLLIEAYVDGRINAIKTQIVLGDTLNVH